MKQVEFVIFSAMCIGVLYDEFVLTSGLVCVALNGLLPNLNL